MKEIKYYVRIFFLKGSYMIIEGTYTLQATPDDVWRCLMDEQILRSAIPGLESLERLDNGQMSITMHISHSPLLGTFRGKAMVTEQQYPFFYALRFEGDSNQSSLSGKGTVHLSERDENTIVAYKSSLNLGKTGVLLPPALVKGIAKHLIQEFFTELAEILRTTHAAPEVIEYSHVQITDEQLNEQSVTQSSDTQPTFLHRVVHRSGLGAGEAAQGSLCRCRNVIHRVLQQRLKQGLRFLHTKPPEGSRAGGTFVRVRGLQERFDVWRKLYKR